MADANFDMVCQYLALFVGDYEPLPRKVEVEARRHAQLALLKQKNPSADSRYHVHASGGTLQGGKAGRGKQVPP